MDVRLSTDVEAYVCNRIIQLLDTKALFILEAADIMGCSRGGLYRLLQQGKAPSVAQLYQLSVYLDVPISHWFPNEQKENNLPTLTTARLTKMIVQTINKLSPVDQAELLQLLNQSVDTLCDALVVARVLLALPKERRQLMLKTLKLLCRR